MELIDEIKKLEETMIAQRRLLHQNPELSYQEFHTTEFLKKELLNSGIELEPLQMPTGVSAIIRGERPGKTICIRHDIDALPIQEATGLSFASEMDGISHACGHDIHAIIAPVSYTHLDVYKRQLLSIFLILLTRFIILY